MFRLEKVIHRPPTSGKATHGVSRRRLLIFTLTPQLANQPLHLSNFRRLQMRQLFFNSLNGAHDLHPSTLAALAARAPQGRRHRMFRASSFPSPPAVIEEPLELAELEFDAFRCEFGVAKFRLLAEAGE